MATGGLLLAVSALFATKANKKFGTFSTSTARCGTSTSFYVKYTSSNDLFTITAHGSHAWAAVYTTTNDSKIIGATQLYTVNGKAPLYLK